MYTSCRLQINGMNDEDVINAAYLSSILTAFQLEIKLHGEFKLCTRVPSISSRLHGKH